MLLPLLVCLAAVSGSGFGATVVSAKHPELRSAQQKVGSRPRYERASRSILTADALPPGLPGG